MEQVISECASGGSDSDGDDIGAPVDAAEVPTPADNPYDISRGNLTCFGLRFDLFGSEIMTCVLSGAGGLNNDC